MNDLSRLSGLSNDGTRTAPGYAGYPAEGVDGAPSGERAWTAPGHAAATETFTQPFAYAGYATARADAFEAAYADPYGSTAPGPGTYGPEVYGPGAYGTAVQTTPAYGTAPHPPTLPDIPDSPGVHQGAPSVLPVPPGAVPSVPPAAYGGRLTVARRSAAPAGEPAPAGSARRRRGVDRLRPDAGPGLRRFLPQALVVVVLAGGTSAFVASDKAVRLTVDGRPRTLHTFAEDVRELLADEGVGVGAHDIVAPAPGEELASGDEIAVRYGRPVSLTLDGQRRQVWTTARTVEGALRQLGVRAEGAYLSASRSSAISRHGLALDVRTERAVTFLADGRTRTVRTNAATVGEALIRAGIPLGGQDTTSVPLGSFPRDGQTVTVLRITGSREVHEEPIPYEVVRTGDPSLFTGTEIVAQLGRPGVRRVTYQLRTVNGVRERPRKIGDEVIQEPVAQRVLVGTARLPGSVVGADGLDWRALASCESGGRAGAVDPSGTYGGLYQFDTVTWRALGGRGRPQDAPAAEQTYRAKKLYIQRGASPWPHCGRRLFR
ncbi:ubiquitin-like domain-containing protein [Streptomyces jumonjinensis]|uniref:ubiquitin-like domain-containing protein n=1 Tax=Streptomyces jumonjinensis TaxID=1945 RepID=UPI00378C4F49